MEHQIIIQTRLKVRQDQIAFDFSLNFFFISGPEPTERTRRAQQPYNLSGDVYRYDSDDDDHFSQSGIFWNQVLDAPARKRLIDNMAAHLIKAQPFIQERVIENMYKVSPDLGKSLTEVVKIKKSSKM